MSTKPQFKMYLDEDFLERLNEVAIRFNRDSKQAVAEEVLRIYLPTWIAVNDSMRRAVEFQMKQIADTEQEVNSQESPGVFNGATIATDTTNIPRLKQEEEVHIKKKRTG